MAVPTRQYVIAFVPCFKRAARFFQWMCKVMLLPLSISRSVLILTQLHGLGSCVLTKAWKLGRILSLHRFYGQIDFNSRKKNKCSTEGTTRGIRKGLLRR
jgi:hypothetical protein